MWNSNWTAKINLSLAFTHRIWITKYFGYDAELSFNKCGSIITGKNYLWGKYEPMIEISYKQTVSSCFQQAYDWVRIGYDMRIARERCFSLIFNPQNLLLMKLQTGRNRISVENRERQSEVERERERCFQWVPDYHWKFFGGTSMFDVKRRCSWQKFENTKHMEKYDILSNVRETSRKNEMRESRPDEIEEEKKIENIKRQNCKNADSGDINRQRQWKIEWFCRLDKRQYTHLFPLQLPGHALQLLLICCSELHLPLAKRRWSLFTSAIFGDMKNTCNKAT